MQQRDRKTQPNPVLPFFLALTARTLNKSAEKKEETRYMISIFKDAFGVVFAFEFVIFYQKLSEETTFQFYVPFLLELSVHQFYALYCFEIQKYLINVSMKMKNHIYL